MLNQLLNASENYRQLLLEQQKNRRINKTFNQSLLQPEEIYELKEILKSTRGHYSNSAYPIKNHYYYNYNNDYNYDLNKKKSKNWMSHV